MSARVDVGIDAQADRRRPLDLRRNALEPHELAFRFDVEAHDPGRERLAHLLLRLAHAGEDDLAGIAARREHARELAARNDVEPASKARKEVQHREARIGLDRVAHQVVGAGERRIVGAPGLDERRPRVDEARRSVLLGDPAERDRLGVQLAVPVVEVVHCRV